MEEGNTEEHKNYLSIEEEKRRKARVVRASVQGPLLRWTSKTEEITVRVDPPPLPVMHAQYPPPYGGAPGYSYVPPQYMPPHHASPSVPQLPFQQWPPPPPPAMYQTESPPQPYVPPPPPQPVFRKEKAAKQYVVHELEQVEKATRPTWSSTMTAMFGDHADWENMRVYTTKGRPFGMLINHVLVKKRLTLLAQFVQRKYAPSLEGRRVTWTRGPASPTRTWRLIGCSAGCFATSMSGAPLWGATFRKKAACSQIRVDIRCEWRCLYSAYMRTSSACRQSCMNASDSIACGDLRNIRRSVSPLKNATISGTRHTFVPRDRALTR